ncbi:dienelactone hydrolase [Bradyrhizobium sp. ARR65]|uniref:alpha/beta hydrolase family protein n=1 Tax=Bradyrhizobium sp. ARR65 TaxID=1040989 RepID=UPI000464DC0B|nr:dienelactone hydrolase [Bradyrhizobium sp. ARR65]
MAQFRFVFAILFCFSMTTAQAAGVKNFDIPASTEGPAIRVLVWTPCAETPHEMDARGATFFAVPGCPIAGEKLPLIVISHGRRGWFGGHHDTAAALADAGFIVAVLNHPGDTWRDTSRTDSLSVLVERPMDMKRLIDYMLDGWPDASRIDTQHIGLYGFSFGGYTGLVVIGGDPDLRKGLPNCGTSSLRACKQLENGELPDQPIKHDPRVKAAVIIDPFPVFLFPKENLKGIAVPVQLWSSDPEQNANGLSGCCAAAINERLPAKADYHFVQNAKHYSFLATCTSKELQEAPAICTDAPGFDRVAFHRALHADVVAFFHQHFTESSKP